MRYTADYELIRGTEHSAGLDLRNAGGLVVISPKDSAVISTSVHIEIPEGFVGLVFIRSSLGFRCSATLANSVGVIDSDYRGEILVKVVNGGDDPLCIENMDRFAQLVILPYFNPVLEKIDRLSDTERGCGGFGSTGKV